MLKGKTKTGFEYEFDEKILKNYELVELLAEVDDNPLVLPKIFKMLLGDRVDELKNHVRDEDGVVDIEKMLVEFQDIFSSIKKNSPQEISLNLPMHLDVGMEFMQPPDASTCSKVVSAIREKTTSNASAVQ